ncbi:MAG: hypothetical protein ACOZQL_24530 [Myxococcota bacterium]
MGRKTSWIAFRTAPEVALAKLRLKGTGNFTELPEAPLTAVTLDTGWFVVVASADLRFVEPKLLEDLSFDCELIGAAIDEDGHVSQAQAWRRGEQRWKVIHDGTAKFGHLQLDGAPPGEVHALYQEARAKRRPGVDFVFEVPVLLVEAVMGFGFGGDQKFEALEPGLPPWRVFRHADGRVWSIRPGGPGYQLRIGAEDDDPVLKERSSDQPLREIEKLVAEQLADGFQAAS